MPTHARSELNQEQDHFDLLPFIALMMTVLAILLFITMAMAAINMGVGAAEGWIPAKGADALAKTPILVEWDGDSLTIQRPSGHQKISIGPAPRRWWNNSGDLHNSHLRHFLSELVDKRDTHYVLFAVRPSGFEYFQTLVSAFREENVSVGFEPVHQETRVQLKLDAVAER